MINEQFFCKILEIKVDRHFVVEIINWEEKFNFWMLLYNASSSFRMKKFECTM